MTIEEQNELVALGQKWLEEAKEHLEISKELDHPGSYLGGVFIGRAQGRADAVDDLRKFLEKYGVAAKLDLIRKLLERDMKNEK